MYLEYGTEADASAAVKTNKDKEWNGKKLFVVAAHSLNRDRLGKVYIHSLYILYIYIYI